jgi:hypothetical protein
MGQLFYWGESGPSGFANVQIPERLVPQCDKRLPNQLQSNNVAYCRTTRRKAAARGRKTYGLSGRAARNCKGKGGCFIKKTGLFRRKTSLSLCRNQGLTDDYLGRGKLSAGEFSLAVGRFSGEQQK